MIPPYNKQFTLQSTLLAAIPFSPKATLLWEKAYNLVHSLFSSSPSFTHGCFQLALSAVPTSLSSFVVLAAIVSYYCAQQGGKKGQSKDWLNEEAYLKVVTSFVSHVLGLRERPDRQVMGNCGGLFKRVTHSIFKDHLLPAIRKAILRNPEELMSGECTKRLVYGVGNCPSLFISDYLGDLVRADRLEPVHGGDCEDGGSTCQRPPSWDPTRSSGAPRCPLQTEQRPSSCQSSCRNTCSSTQKQALVNFYYT